MWQDFHTEILKHEELKDFYDMMPEKFNNKTNGITQRRFLMHGNPLLADWVTKRIGDGWITDLSQMSRLKKYVDEKGVKTGFVMWPVRTAVSGKQTTPGGATEIMEILGKEESLRRIRKGIELLSK